MHIVIFRAIGIGAAIGVFLVIGWYSPGTWGTKLVVSYLSVGVIGATIAIIVLFITVVRHHKWNNLIWLIWKTVFKSKEVFLVTLSLAVFLICYGYNFVTLWPALLIPFLTPPKKQLGTDIDLYRRLSRADQNPGLRVDKMLFPMATVVIAVVVYFLAYFTTLSIPYVTVAFVLWIGLIARLIYYNLPNYSPGMEDVPTYLRRRYDRPRLIYFFLLAVEGVGLLLILPIVAFQLSPDVLEADQYRQAIASVYKPDDWLAMVMHWPGTQREWITNSSGILFDIALLAYVVQSVKVLVGKNDPFSMTDKDYEKLAENALHAGDVEIAQDKFNKIKEHSNDSYRVGACLDIANSDFSAAATKVESRRKLIKRQSDPASIFHEMVNYAREARDAENREISAFGWAIRAGVPDEDFAHEIFKKESKVTGQKFVEEVLRTLNMPTDSDIQNSLKALSEERPLTAGMALNRVALDFEDQGLLNDLKILIQEQLSAQKSSNSPLRQAILYSFFAGELPIECLDKLTSLLDNMVSNQSDEDQIGSVMLYVGNVATYVADKSKEKQDQFDFNRTNSLRSKWTSIVTNARNNTKYSTDLQLVIGHVESVVRGIAAKGKETV